MSKIVKKMKIMQPGGTLSDYVPIGAEAENINVDGESVETKLDKKPYYYDTVADMKADTKLKAGDMAVTLGYYSANDGGAAEYKIVNIASQTEYQEELNNNLYAILIVDNEVNIKQLGAYGDGIHDDTNVLKGIILKAKNNNTKITSPKNKTYLISETLDISNLYIDLNGATIKANMNDDIFVIDTQDYYGKLTNITINCNKVATTGIHIIYGRKHDFININIIDVNNIAIKSESGYENYFYNLHIDGSNTATNTTGLYLTSSDSQYAKIIMKDMTTGIHAIDCFNNYNNIHSWISRQDLVANSSYIKAKGGRMILTDCYCDTYNYCFNIYDIPTTIMNSNMNVYNNVGVYTDEIATNNRPTFLYTTLSTGSNYITNINCMFTGYSSSIKTLLSNQNYFNGDLTDCSITNFDHTLAYSITDITNTEAITTTINNLTKISKMVTIELVCKVTVTANKTSFTIGNIPSYFRTSKEIIDSCSYGSNAYNTIGVVNIFFNPNGNILASFPPNISAGDYYIKIYNTYIGKLEA